MKEELSFLIRDNLLIDLPEELTDQCAGSILESDTFILIKQYLRMWASTGHYWSDPRDRLSGYDVPEFLIEWIMSENEYEDIDDETISDALDAYDESQEL